MSDKELLEFAAKAAGYEYECTSHTGYPENDQHQIRAESGSLIDWNPLTDDGDALRLAVKLGLTVQPKAFDDYSNECAGVWLYSTDGGPADIEEMEPIDNDPYAATRRAIVRAAAEIGRGME